MHSLEIDGRQAICNAEAVGQSHAANGAAFRSWASGGLESRGVRLEPTRGPVPPSRGVEAAILVLNAGL